MKAYDEAMYWMDPLIQFQLTKTDFMSPGIIMNTGMTGRAHFMNW